MEFSEVVSVAGGARQSHDGQLVASVVRVQPGRPGVQLVVQRTDDMQVVCSVRVPLANEPAPATKGPGTQILPPQRQQNQSFPGARGGESSKQVAQMASGTGAPASRASAAYAIHAARMSSHFSSTKPKGPAGKRVVPGTPSRPPAKTLVSSIQWSPDDSKVLLTTNDEPRILVQEVVRSQEDDAQSQSQQQPLPFSELALGASGLVFAVWSPDAEHVFAQCEYGLGAMVWSLRTGIAHWLPDVKQASSPKCVSFTSDGAFLAVAERDVDAKDAVAIYGQHQMCTAKRQQHTWECCVRFETDMIDVAGISWAPNNGSLVAWESGVLDYLVCLYAPDGSLLESYRAYEDELGVHDVCWSPDGRLLAISSLDHALRIINVATWKLVTILEHPQQLARGRYTVYRETALDESLREEAIVDVVGAHDVAATLHELSFSMNRKRVMYDADNAELPTAQLLDLRLPQSAQAASEFELGFMSVLWSPSGSLVATVDRRVPHCVWVWNVRLLGLEVILVQQNPVTHAAWDQTERLWVCTESASLFFWSRDQAACVNLPFDELRVRTLAPAPAPSPFLLFSAEQKAFCIMSQ
ncbi:WD repeat-containing protein WRAP73 [Porphyridium purpureum]|uniref:WD repeat-containing protein WRAP73 n=1 Tax=Porphyridium purpureum TaxID=35688 RepID=A0A5J4YSJ7_PORPP|nr:WD repeat-containing protein WRAP73 [Porphyridium purpureum]|eukprot:POR2135..scf227_4